MAGRLIRFRASLFFFLAVGTGCLQAQQVQLNQFLDDGEYSLALENVPQNAQPDIARAQIAKAQLAGGARQAALMTIADIEDSSIRSESLESFGGGFPAGGGSQPLRQGGVSQQDFDQLIDLVKGVIAPDSWADTGAGEGTISAFPSGVYVDAQGVLQRIRKTKRGSALDLILKKKSDTQTDAMQASNLRKVSLTRLERAMEFRAARGLPVTDDMKYLAGITRIQYVLVDPETREVIVAGPAGGWQADSNGRVISKTEKSPVLLLDDLSVCLNNALHGNGKFGCSIVPRKKNLAATKAYVETTRKRGKQFQKGLQAALGKQDIDVHGIPASSHAARILVEADYRMKLVGMGLEPSIKQVPSYLERVKLDASGNPPPMDVVRWWFAADYEKLIANEAETLFEFTGPGVQVLAETEFINRQGDRLHTGKAVGPTATFAKDFTTHYGELAQQYPIYRELNNVFDLAIVAGLIREFGLGRRVNHEFPYLTRYAKSDGEPVSLEVDSVINKRVIVDRRGGETVRHTLLGVSGGVQFDVSKFVASKNAVIEKDPEFEGIGKAAIGSIPKEIEIWWWD